ncbi:MAG: zinc ribbon domain-containing protein [Deltaproteobacteria bacterium]|nr:zinc ribbon domain-containing protein [Deltaproteobacteria bacterium]
MALTCSTCGYENRADAAYCGMCKAVFRPRAAGSAVARGTPPEATAARAAASEPAAAPRSASPTFDPAAIARELAALPDPFLESFGVTLDRSLASLRLLDLFIDETWGTDGEAPGDDSYRPSRGKQHLILGFGSYLGEVVRDLVGGAWWDDPAHPGNPTATALVIGESRIFPIARVYKRLRDGASDPLHPLALYVVRQIDPRRLVACAGDYERHAQHFVSASQLPGERVDEIAAELLRTAAGLDPSRALELEARLAALVKRRAADGRSATASPSSTPPPPAPAVAHPPDAPRGAPVEAPPPAAAEPGGLAHRGLELLIAGELDAALEPLGAWARAVETDL